jgi:tetratricopeptide (TPR) repeat protein
VMLTPDADPIRELRALLGAGRYQEILDRYVADAPAPPNDPGVALAVATAATRLGRLGDGESLADRALVTFRSRADDDGRMRCLNLLGAIAWERGDLPAAARHWQGALELARVDGDTLMVARASNNLASALHLDGRVVEARSLYREALLAYQRLADRRGAAETMHNLALIARQEGDLGGAEEAGAEAVRHAELVSDSLLLALMLTGHAETRIGMGDFALAEPELERAEVLARTANDPLGVAEVSRVRALRWLELRRPELALALVEPAVTVAADLGSMLLEAECAAIAFRALRALDRPDEARDRFRQAEKLFRSLGASRLLAELEALAGR